MEKLQGKFIYGIVMSGTIEGLRNLLLKGADADEVEIIIERLVTHGVKEKNVDEIKSENDIAEFVTGMDFGRRMNEEIVDTDIIRSTSKPGPTGMSIPDLNKDEMFFVRRDSLYLELFLEKLNTLMHNGCKMTDCYSWGKKEHAFRFASLEAFEFVENQIMCGRNVELVKAD